MSEWHYDGGLGLSQPARGAQTLNSAEALRLLGSVSYGRVVFTINALPAIRPVNHLLDGAHVVIRTRLSSAVSLATRSTAALVAAYEADSIDPESQTGWSVVVTGHAVTVSDDRQIARYERLLRPWINHADTVVAITLEMVSGFRLC